MCLWLDLSLPVCGLKYCQQSHLWDHLGVAGDALCYLARISLDVLACAKHQSLTYMAVVKASLYPSVPRSVGK